MLSRNMLPVGESGDTSALYVTATIEVAHCIRSAARRPRAVDAGAICRRGSVGRVPDHGEDAVIILSGCSPEIGVELARTEFRCGQAQRDVGSAGSLDWCAATPRRSRRHW